MKNIPRLLAAAVCFSSLIHNPSARAAETDLIPVAVLDLEANEPKLKEKGTQLALLLTTQLSTTDGVITVERQEIAKLLGEQELGNSGMVEPATAARIGHLSGARVLVTGRIFTVSGETTAALKIMSTETGRVFGVVESFPSDAPPAGPAAKLAAKIADILQAKHDSLVAQILSDQDLVASIKTKLAGRAAASFTLAIPEQHIGPPVVDPAAETEIGLILGSAGFTRLTGEAAAHADFLIEGEAFSEAGIRRGNLVSCRARVELKVIARKSGKVVLTDRQTTWAVDSAEHMAAKLALQRAGAELSGRIAEALITKE